MYFRARKRSNDNQEVKVRTSAANGASQRSLNRSTPPVPHAGLKQLSQRDAEAGNTDGTVTYADLDMLPQTGRVSVRPKVKLGSDVTYADVTFG